MEEQLVPLGRVQQVLRDLVGVRLGRGTLVRGIQQASAALAPVEAQLTAARRLAPVLPSDETGVRRSGRLVWMQVASTSRLTRYAVHAKRGGEATDAMGMLPDYTRVSVHGGLQTYHWYTRCRHALCNIHHLHELTFLEEHYQQPWATAMKGVLLEMKAAVGHAPSGTPSEERDAPDGDVGGALAFRIAMGWRGAHHSRSDPLVGAGPHGTWPKCLPVRVPPQWSVGECASARSPETAHPHRGQVPGSTVTQPRRAARRQGPRRRRTRADTRRHAQTVATRTMPHVRCGDLQAYS